MKREFIDRTGQKINKLTFLKYMGHQRWQFLCECGTVSERRARTVLIGTAKSCGCSRPSQKKGKDAMLFKHGDSGTRLWKIWIRMRSRCSVKGNKNYYGKGIRVCDEWNSSWYSFKLWSLNNGYRDDLSIDRIDNNGNYNPENCRWTDPKTQMNNRSVCNYLYYNGEKRTVMEWSEHIGVGRGVIYKCIKNGMGIEWAKKYTKPSYITVSHNGETNTLKQWSIILGININTLISRYQKGFATDRMLHVGKINRYEESRAQAAISNNN